jgi:hypothetical protein
MKKEISKNINNFLFSWRKGWFLYLASWANSIQIFYITVDYRPDWASFIIGIFYGWVAFAGFKVLKINEVWYKKEYRNRIL